MLTAESVLSTYRTLASARHALAPLGLTPTQFCAMWAMSDEDGDETALVSEVADALGLDMASTSRALSVLRSKGLVEPAPPTGDARQKPSRLTDAGWLALAQAAVALESA